MRSAQNLCFVVNRFYALFRLNGSSKPSLTSKPLLTIALKILKTIEKPLVPMVGPPKKHSMVMVQLCQNHWKTIDGNGGLKKNINHSIALKNWPSLWSTGSHLILQRFVNYRNQGSTPCDDNADHREQPARSRLSTLSRLSRWRWRAGVKRATSLTYPGANCLSAELEILKPQKLYFTLCITIDNLICKGLNGRT